ncbi:MAG: hypothetical protein CVT98_11145, partial [Bacteroidetes bacterium HGW-Bacteroidetes-15]
MKKFITYFLLITASMIVLLIIVSRINREKSNSLPEVELLYENNISLPYPEVIKAYEMLDKRYREAKLITYGPTDIGKPLQLFVISKSKIFNPDQLRKKGYRI